MSCVEREAPASGYSARRREYVTSAADVLRKEELRSVIRRHFGEIPAVSDFDFRTVYTSLFTLLSKETAATEVAETLAARCRHTYADLESVPENLKLAVLASNLKKIPSF